MAFWQSHDDYADNNPEYTECHFRFAGQYISPDPIGLLGGFNPYGYVHCPTGSVDPFRLAGTSQVTKNKLPQGMTQTEFDNFSNALKNAIKKIYQMASYISTVAGQREQQYPVSPILI
ncbi:hypothetical protein KAH51_18635 [Proteus vulgaris]|uniref:hypothetical protein n=1 Tax=Proteus vulgaris TaxID=585 RepID=UPI001B35A8EE|nr:hypothetical protein [Proteus vulgaris]MBQ0215457.1 hypothetical protein [Proteus vulgaris]